MNTTRARKGNRRGRRAIWIWVVTLSTLAGLLEATETRIFRQRTRAELSRGTLEGLALTAEGALRPATRFERGAEIEEPYVFSAVRSPNGWWLGTGNAGRLLEVGDDGSVRTAWTAPEPEIFALHAEEGAVYVGSSPRGGVYELESGELESGGLENGEAEKIFDPEATYVWSIARAPWGELIVATGDPGHLYAIDGDGASTLLYESEEPHLRSLLAVGDQVLVGTSGEGRVLSLTADGSVRTVYDSDLPEVVGFAASPEGRWFAAAVSSEASLSAPRQGANGGSAQEPAVEVSVEPAESVDSAASTPRTILLAGRGATGAEEVARLDEETGYALAWIDGRVWLGTGVEGKVYSLYPEGLSLEATAGDRQVVALFGGEPASLVTTNGAAVYTAAGRGQGGTYLSQPLDAEATARFGRLRWLGSADDESAVLFSVRSGSSSTPDRTWSGWSAARSGREIDLAEVPAGRYVQWRLQLEPWLRGAGGGDLCRGLVPAAQSCADDSLVRSDGSRAGAGAVVLQPRRPDLRAGSSGPGRDVHRPRADAARLERQAQDTLAKGIPDPALGGRGRERRPARVRPSLPSRARPWRAAVVSPR